MSVKVRGKIHFKDICAVSGFVKVCEMTIAELFKRYANGVLYKTI